jgi:hypothetical protein
MKRKIFLFLIATLFTFALGNLAQISGQIKGQLLKANGKPLSYTEIELVPVDSQKPVNDPNLVGISDTVGRFAFPKIPPGKYTLSINFDDKPTELSPYATFFYPNAKKRADAEIFEIDGSAKPRTITFQLPPPLAQLKVIGKVVNREGQPVPEVYVHLRDVMFGEVGFPFSAQTDKNGNFAFKGFENRLYQVGAILLARPLKFPEPPEPIAMATSEVFVLNAQTSSLTLTLKELDNATKKQNQTIGKLILQPEYLLK